MADPGPTGTSDSDDNPIFVQEMVAFVETYGIDGFGAWHVTLPRWKRWWNRIAPSRLRFSEWRTYWFEDSGPKGVHRLEHLTGERREFPEWGKSKAAFDAWREPFGND